MTQLTSTFLRQLAQVGVWAALLAACSPLSAQQSKPRNQLKEPLLRVAGNNNTSSVKAEKAHPLDPALARARAALKKSREEIKDYSCVVVKRERINGVVGDYEYMFTKIRNRKRGAGGQIVTPLSVYMTFLKPANIKGREALYVEGKNNGKLFAHEGGASLLGKIVPSVWLPPNGPIAMRNNRYPITEIGIENLVVRLIEKGVRDRKVSQCDVSFRENATINGRKCTMLQVIHPQKRPEFDFYVAQIFIDDEYGVPIRYAAFDWPVKQGGAPVVIEEYTYLNLKLNVGLTDSDFDPGNPNYNF